MKKISLFEITPEELKDWFESAIDKRFIELQSNFQPKVPEEYLTRTETAKLLKVDLSTIHRWRKAGKLNGYALEGKIYYKRSEVEVALIKL